MARTLFALLAVLATTAQAAEPARFVGRETLPDGQTVVVAEGDFETRSLGSYSVRLYEAATAPDETTFFVSGIVVPREGTVESMMLTDADSDGEVELLVIARSVGTGGYRSVRVFDIGNGLIDPLITVDDLPPDADVLDVLKTRATVRDEVKKRQADRLKR